MYVRVCVYMRVCVFCEILAYLQQLSMESHKNKKSKIQWGARTNIEDNLAGLKE